MMWRVIWFVYGPSYPPGTATRVEMPDQLIWESHDFAQLYAALHPAPGTNGFKIVPVDG